MSTPSEIFDELVSTTYRHAKKKLADNVSNHNALLRRLSKKGLIEKLDGGTEIQCPLEYAENATYQRFQGFDTLDIRASDIITSAKYPWRQIAVNIVVSNEDLRKNRGKSQIIKLAKSRVKNAMNSFKNNFSVDLYSDGTAANQINGAQALVSDTGQGTVGGLNSTDNAFWRNIVQSAASPLQGGGAITPSSSTIQTLMNHLWLETTRGGDSTDFIVASNDYYSFYEESLTALKRYTGESDGADGGLVSLKYKGADVFHDGGSKGGGIPDAHMYFMNTDYIGLSTHEDAWMTLEPVKRAINQDATVRPMISMCNMTCSNRSLQGVLKA